MAPGRVGNTLGKSGIARTTIDGSIGCFINAGGQFCAVMKQSQFQAVSQMPSTKRGTIRPNNICINCASSVRPTGSFALGTPNPGPLGGVM